MTSTRPVVAGADTHSDTHHVAVLDAATGAELGNRQFPATTAGYRAILAFVAIFGQLTCFGVEGTNSYGAGLSRFLRDADVQVREVIRPNRAQRRLRGKSDRWTRSPRPASRSARRTCRSPRAATAPLNRSGCWLWSVTPR